MYLKGKLTEFGFHIKESNITRTKLHLNNCKWCKCGTGKG